ncbi:hypothetical protein QQY66_11870 [Streptomyces sp. DG2A-72]|uniref:hypothetical protein n=1 Tax=Streptomyces sp. DG2A-72 TaxID=3051386 RepID=UPI00265C2C7A|nr:hypothetical protein [Streptomyces sp. DG2A-72]MDO0932351.1 hypothetical protein [Streptomyces sp. DG2A-72]
MGIRMLNRRTAWALAQANADATPPPPPPLVPVFSAAASTARIPTDLPAALRGAAARLRHRFSDSERPAVRPRHTSDLRLWTDLARSYLALVLSRLPRSRPVQTVTVFIATASTVSGRPDGSGSAPQPPGTRATP